MDVLILDLGDKFKGTCKLADYADKMELLSFSHGVAMQITGDISNSERTSGKPNHQDFTITKYLDLASPAINEACCKGDAIALAKIVVGRNEAGSVTKQIEYQLKNVVISSVSVGGGGGDKPVETVTLNYNHITWDYKAQKPEATTEGQLTKKWDLAKNNNT